MSDAGRSLSEMRGRLSELLGLLDDREADAASLERAMGECARSFAKLEQSPPTDEDELELEETLRLNTVVSSRVRSEVESLARGIRQAKQARSHVDARGTADVTGTSCDISG